MSLHTLWLQYHLITEKAAGKSTPTAKEKRMGHVKLIWKNPRTTKIPSPVTVLALDGDLCLPWLSLQQSAALVGDKPKSSRVPVVTILLKNRVRAWWTLLSFIENLRRPSELQESSRANPLTWGGTYMHVGRAAALGNQLVPRKLWEICFLQCPRSFYIVWAVVPPPSARPFQKPLHKPIISSALPTNIHRSEFS